MIEDGSAVISSSLSTPTMSLIGRGTITIAPVFVSCSGMGMAPSGMKDVSYSDSFSRMPNKFPAQATEAYHFIVSGNGIVAADSVSEHPQVNTGSNRAIKPCLNTVHCGLSFVAEGKTGAEHQYDLVCQWRNV
jgi:hypothetical protein